MAYLVTLIYINNNSTRTRYKEVQIFLQDAGKQCFRHISLGTNEESNNE